METRIPFQWNTANFNWNAVNPMDGKTYPANESVTGTNLWDDCALIIKLINAGGLGEVEEYFAKEPKKKKRFIKLLYRVEGKEYKETKEVLDRKISIRDIELVAKDVLKIDIKMQ